MEVLSKISRITEESLSPTPTDELTILGSWANGTIQVGHYVLR